MDDDIKNQVAADLLYIPPLIARVIRRNYIKPTLPDSNRVITPLHFEVMKELKKAGTVHVAKLGHKLQIAKAQMTQLIDKLVELGVVARATDPDDRRTINISLTDYGKAAFEKHNKLLINAIRENISQLSPLELEYLSDSLRKIHDILLKTEDLDFMQKKPKHKHYHKDYLNEK